LIDELERIAKAEGVTVDPNEPRAPRPHELRHTVASILIDADVSPQKVADMLGDKVETILRVYRHKLRPVAGDVAALPMAAVYGVAS
jgi:integrase